VAGDIQKELSEYKLKLKRAEQEITTLEGNVCINIVYTWVCFSRSLYCENMGV